MLVIITTALITLLVSLDFTYTTNAKDLVRNDNVNDMLKEILQRLEKMQSHMDQVERNNNRRFDQIEANMKDMKADNANHCMVMETIVEQQMVITAEIFTVSQTLPFCCCHYQNTPGPEQPDTTTATSLESTTATPLKSMPSNCAEAMGKSGSDGIYNVNITNSDIGPFDVYCMQNIAKDNPTNGTWMIIQRRQDSTTDFYRNWNTYKREFGDLKGNYWIGLEKIHTLTKATEQELWVQLEDIGGRTGWAKYSHFAIGNEDELYKLKNLGSYDGTAEDSLELHRGQMWSTYDKDNDRWYRSCADMYKGAWWFNNCASSSLNGKYSSDKTFEKISWGSFGAVKSNPVKYVHMAIRPRS